MQSKKSFFKNVSLFWFLTIIICLGLFFSLPVLAKVVEFYDTTSIKLNVRAGSQQLTVPLQTWSDNENNILTIMNSSGHIGIGTTEIGTDSLRVQGDGYISGNLNIGNSIKVEGVSGANINCGEDLVLGEPLIDGGVVIGGTCQSITEAGGVGGTGTENFIPKWNVHGTGLVDTNIIYESNDYNVGIGTTTPGIYKLNVWGKISADSENLYTDGLGNLTAQSFYDKGNATKYLDPSKTDGYGLVIADSISIEGTARANYFAGNVGIGTTGPGKRLEVKENIGAEMGIRISNNAGGALQTLEFHDTVNPKAKIQSSNVGADLRFFTGSGASNIEQMRILSSGNVGIGTTGPSEKLVVGDDIGNITSYTGISVGDSNYAGVFMGSDINNHGKIQYSVGSGYLIFGTKSNSVDYLGTMYLKDGNVGIGTTAPSQQIDMTGDLTIGGGDLYFSSSDDTGKRIQTSDTFNILNNTSAWGARMGSLQVSSSYSGTAPTNGILFYTDANLYRSAADQLRTNDSLIIDGNVGIGTTGPGAKLEVASPSSGVALKVGRVSGQPSIQGTSDWFIIDNAGSEPLALNYWSPNNVLLVQGGGNVGIGTTGPSRPLTVFGDIQIENKNALNINSFFDDTNSHIYSTTGMGAAYPHNAYSNLVIESDEAHDIVFATGADGSVGSSMVIQSSGNVGIGTTSPGVKLDVNGGNVRTTNQLVSTVATGTAPLAVSSTTLVSNLNADLLDGSHASVFTTHNEVTDLGTVSFTNSGTTANFISELESKGAFNNYHSIMKATWSYDGNSDISDTGYGTFELAGCVIETWTDNANDVTRGNIHVRVTRPTTGSGGGKILVYNDQGTGYSPGWRQIWTSTTDGSGSGLDADLLDGHNTSYFQTTLTNPVTGTGTGTGTSGYLPKFTGTSTIGDSPVYTDGAYVGIGTTNPSQKLDVNGTTLATRYYIDSTSNYIDTTGSYLTLQSGGNEIVIGGGATTHINYRAAPSGTATSWVWHAGSSSTYASHTMGNLIVHGKINADEIDPVYEIDGVKYATYGHFTTGLNEETTGKVKLSQKIRSTKHEIRNKSQIQNSLEIRNSDLEIGGTDYQYVIDFNEQEIGSDLWLFRQVTAFGHDWQDLVVSLTPEGRAEVWYELDEKENTLTIFGTQPVAVSYRLIAPRFDWPERDTNLATNQEAQGIKVSR
jgi:hypothetical protein